ncbi:ATP-binding protein [Vibrio sp. S4M6]|uniref:ATP-binding protein n=1 Tax=Vibrio sinus TaxID=2946865 RepID=UPI00202A808C|nr:ATP-binding protein [Vibrio sinus]MCL9780952.1 ATP-binding protein [Vibrio sinus]
MSENEDNKHALKSGGLWSLSIRGWFLVSPILAIFLTIVFFIATNNVITQHERIFAKLERQQLPEITKFSELIINLTDVHNQLTYLLISTISEPDEERVYVEGKSIIRQILSIEEKLEQELVKNEGLFHDNKEIYKRIYDDFILYKIAVFGAIELSTVNAKLAEKELNNANKFMYDLVRTSQSLVKHSWQSLTGQYHDASGSSHDSGLISGISIMTIALMILSAMYFSKRLTRDLININDSLIQLSRGNENITLPENSPPYLQDSIQAVKTFQQMLISQQIQKAELKSLNDELTKHKANLEQTVQERTDEVKKSYEKLKEAETSLIESQKLAALGALVSGISHEINTPIGISLTAATHLIEETQQIVNQNEKGTVHQQDFDNFTEDTIEISNIIISNIERASELIKSFKGVAVDQTSEKMRTIEVKKYIDDIVLSLRPQLKKTNHEIRILCSATITANTIPGALSQILTNLIMNSVTHGFENIDKGTIEISVITRENDVEIEYKDNGIGMNDEHQKKIFEPFFTTKHGKGGSGLGMHIVYDLATKTLQGSISCRSTLGEGTVFTLTFPKNLEHNTVDPI